MARLYANEQFPREVSELLRTMGHDVLTVQEAGNANLGIPDEEVLAFAVSNNRVVITLNRQDFIQLHRANNDQTNSNFMVMGVNALYFFALHCTIQASTFRMK